uniref:DNA-binding protein D-ETS-4 n=1 Tax=Parastrongyloides trichosuri TaxID=131310 RepID=A0A0N5A378_PARTI
MNSSVMTLQMNQINGNSWLPPALNNNQHLKAEFDMQYDRLNSDNSMFMSSPDSSKTSCNSDTITDDIFAELETTDKESINKPLSNYQMPYNTQKNMLQKDEISNQYYKNISYQNPNVSVQSSDNNGVDLYRDLILRHLVQDINSTCMRLYLPNNPAIWTSEETIKWISEMCTQFRLKVPQSLFLSGRILVSMTQEDFLNKAPESGETLYAQLQLWKTAFDSCQQNINNSNNCYTLPVNLPSTPAATNHSNRKDAPITWQQSPTVNGPKRPLYPNEQDSTSKHYYQTTNQTMQHQQTIPNGYIINSSPVPISNNNHQYCVTPTGTLSSSPEFNRSQNFEMYFNQNTSKNIQNNMMSPSNSASSSNSSVYNEEDDFTNLLQINNQHVHYNSSPISEYFQGNISINMSEPKHQIYNCDNGNQVINVINGNCINNNNVEVFNNINGPNDTVKINSDTITSTTFQRSSGTVHLWHFIRELLDQPNEYSSCVRWVDRNEGTFKIESSHHLARYWGIRKNRAQMNYDKLSRSLRQYYKKGIIQKPEKKQRLVYKFLPPYNM